MNLLSNFIINCKFLIIKSTRLFLEVAGSSQEETCPRTSDGHVIPIYKKKSRKISRIVSHYCTSELINTGRFSKQCLSLLLILPFKYILESLYINNLFQSF